MSKGAEIGRIAWISRGLAMYGDRSTTAYSTMERTPVHLAVLSVSLFFQLFVDININTFLSSFKENKIYFLGLCDCSTIFIAQRS